MGLGELFLTTTALGYLAMSCKDAVRGKEPMPLSPQSVLRATLQGGALGLFGDMINPMRKVSKQLSATNGKMTEKLSNLLQGMEQARMYASGKSTVEQFVSETEVYEKQNNKKIFLTACLESCNSGFRMLCILMFLQS